MDQNTWLNNWGVQCVWSYGPFDVPFCRVDARDVCADSCAHQFTTHVAKKNSCNQ